MVGVGGHGKRSGYEVYLLEATYKDPVGCAARNVHGFTQDGIQRMAEQWEEAPSLYLKLDMKRSGYEVYLLEATYKDPVGCAARNVHGFTQDGIQRMAEQWEEAPSLYLKLDMKSLLHGDDLEESGIQEVDMDTEDGDPSSGQLGSEERNLEAIEPLVGDYAPDGSLMHDNRFDTKDDHPAEEVKELGKSKWSDVLDEDDAQRTGVAKGNLSALSGLIQAYGKGGKSVHWGDQVCIACHVFICQALCPRDHSIFQSMINV
ncbi:unnamed protein product [Ilex paraguariensis]|uniref:Uncharacterized protein n=1 Tax=Ilex paraguariensis TaxID=185542 RepID=A0ABC8SM41_9AQUA